ncbi:hypothetical protein [Haloechinothrix alba]|uniref:hypothetical protein n=1 Tax=Haloechinothrix alba TaxID=664784 RepID=UPI000B796111|nr:hypothetical protein [Haloechinothrix alba]
MGSSAGTGRHATSAAPRERRRGPEAGRGTSRETTEQRTSAIPRPRREPPDGDTDDGFEPTIVRGRE